MGHNICYKGVIWKIIPKLILLPFDAGALVQSAGPLYADLFCAVAQVHPSRHTEPKQN